MSRLRPQRGSWAAPKRLMCPIYRAGTSINLQPAHAFERMRSSGPLTRRLREQRSSNARIACENNSRFQTAHLVPAVRFPRPGFASLLRSPAKRGGRSAERRSGACEAPVGRAMTRHARRLRGALRRITRDARLSALHRGDFSPGAALPSPSAPAAMQRRAFAFRIRAASSSQPGRSAWRATSRASRGERLRAAAAGYHASLRLRIASRRRPSMSKAAILLAQPRYVVKCRSQNVVARLREMAAARSHDAGEPRRMRATTKLTLARLRLNPCAGGASIPPPPAHAGKPTWEERHGQGSDAEQQGEEEAKGGVEQEEERRPRPLAVRFGTGAAPARPESLRQEELAERPIDGEALHLTLAGRVASPERGVGQARTQSQRYSAAIILPA